MFLKQAYPIYEYGPSGFKSRVDYQSSRLKAFIDAVGSEYGIQISFECLIADTEAKVKCRQFLKENDEEISMKANKVVKRVAKVFPGKVVRRSEVFSLQNSIYIQNFPETYQSILKQILESKPNDNPRLISRVNALLSVGINEEIALQIALEDLALQDAEYAMEGLWMVNESKWDALLMIDNFPLSAVNRTFRLVGINNILPVMFPVEYENL